MKQILYVMMALIVFSCSKDDPEDLLTNGTGYFEFQGYKYDLADCIFTIHGQKEYLNDKSYSAAGFDITFYSKVLKNYDWTDSIKYKNENENLLDGLSTISIGFPFGLSDGKISNQKLITGQYDLIQSFGDDLFLSIIRNMKLSPRSADFQYDEKINSGNITYLENNQVEEINISGISLSNTFNIHYEGEITKQTIYY